MSDVSRILIADDEPLFLHTTAALLEQAGFECRCAPHGHAALEMLEQERFHLILSDLKMPGNLQFELLRRSREAWPETPLIVVTGAPSLPTAIESLRLGIADYLLKPVKFEDLLASVRKALTDAAARRAVYSTSDAVAQRGAGESDLIGTSEVMRDVRELVVRCAASDANVLITGESGTGKELVAEEIHRRSRRADRPFQVIDCTAIPETLFESILFGHVRGAFTGAIRDQPGLLAAAEGGTVFLDEIGELPLSQQSKLLRLIQTQSFVPGGMNTPRQVDVRFVCATNRDLAVEIQEGRFRGDLFYRLAVIHVEIPRLADRGDDVLLLAEHFLNSLRGDGSPVAGFSPEVVEMFRRYHWPGNVRELRNAVERAHALCRGTMIVPADLPRALRERPAGGGGGRPASRAAALEEAEKQYLVSLLKDHHGNIAECARAAQVSRQCLHGLLRKHQVNSSEYR